MIMHEECMSASEVETKTMTYASFGKYTIGARSVIDVEAVELILVYVL